MAQSALPFLFSPSNTNIRCARKTCYAPCWPIGDRSNSSDKRFESASLVGRERPKLDNKASSAHSTKRPRDCEQPKRRHACAPQLACSVNSRQTCSHAESVPFSLANEILEDLDEYNRVGHVVCADPNTEKEYLGRINLDGRAL